MLFPIQLLLFLLLQQWVLSGFSLRASISLKKLGNNLTTHFPLGAYVPVEFNLLVDDTIKLHEKNGLLGVAVRSCIVYPQYHCANWLPVMTSGRSAITKRTSSNPASNPASNHKSEYGFVLPPQWKLPVDSFHGLVRPTTLGRNKVTLEAQFCIATHRCADIISSPSVTLRVTNDSCTLCAQHPVVAQLSALQLKRAGRKIISPTSVMRTSSSTVGAVMVNPGGTPLSLHQLMVSFMYFELEAGKNSFGNTSKGTIIGMGTGTIRNGPVPGKLCVQVKYGAFASQVVTSCMRSEVLEGGSDIPLPWRFLPSELGVSGITPGNTTQYAETPSIWSLRFGLTSPASASASSTFPSDPSVHLFGEVLVSITLHPDDVNLRTIHSSVERTIMTNSWAYNPLFHPSFIAETTFQAAALHSSRRHTYVSFIWGETYASDALLLAHGLQEVGTKLEFMVVIMTLPSDDLNVISDTTMARLQNSPDIDRVLVIQGGEGTDPLQDSTDGKDAKRTDPLQDSTDGKDAKTKARLQKYSRLLFTGIRGHGIPPAYDTRVFSKLLAFALLEYNSVAVIDVDVVVAKNIDAALLVVGDPTNHIHFAGVGTGYFSAAFFVLRPDLKVMSEMIQVVRVCDSWRFPEQDLLNVFYGAGHPSGHQVQQRLPDKYLCINPTNESVASKCLSKTFYE